jgi:uncharacterized membrane protein
MSSEMSESRQRNRFYVTKKMWLVGVALIVFVTITVRYTFSGALIFQMFLRMFGLRGPIEYL